MRKSSQRVPKLTKHRASGQGVVRLSGKDFYCGLFGTAAAQMEYDRITPVSGWRRYSILR